MHAGHTGKLLRTPISLWLEQDHAIRVEALRRGLAHRVGEIVAMRRAGWGMKVDRNIPLTLHQSKLGGLPAAPADFEWPRIDGHPCRFVAQINLAALPAHSDPALHASLPESGMLLFFTNYEMVDELSAPANVGALVHHIPPNLELRSTHPPADIEILWPLKEAPLAITPQWSMPSTCDDNPEFQDWDENDIKALDDWGLDSDEGGSHYLLGIATTLQIPLDHPSHPDLGPQWQLLFQLWSEEECDLDIFGGCAAYFAIQREALQKHDFRHISIIHQFT